MEPESSLPHSQVPATCPYPGEVRNIKSMPPHPTILLFENPFSYHPSTHRSLKWSVPISTPHHNPVCTSIVPYMCYILRPSHSSRVDHPNNICWEVQIIKFLLMLPSSFPLYLAPLRFKYLPEHSILEQTQPMFLPQYERPSFILIQKKKRKNYNPLYLDIYIFG